MGMNGIDEKEMMLRAVNELTMTVDLPLSIDSSYVDVVESALRIYPGRALINSISLEPEKFEKLIPIAKKYGAMFILLPLSDAGLPKDLDEKKTIIHTILDEAKRQGMAEEDIVVDGLVATIGANKNAALEVLETIRYCKNELGVATICGLSNISFGLPERVFVNTAFLTLAIGQGLTMAIANPSQTLLVNAALASDLLLNKEEADLHYINGVAGAVITQSQPKNEVAEEDGHPLYLAVVKGKSGHVLELVEEELKKAPVINDVSQCVLCGMCLRGCVGGALDIDRKRRTWTIDPAACVQCGVCVEHCPKQCLSLNKAYTFTADGDSPEPVSFHLPERKRPSPGKPAVKPDA